MSSRGLFLLVGFFSVFIGITVWRIRLEVPEFRGALSNFRVQSHLSNCRKWKDFSSSSYISNPREKGSVDFRGGAARDAAFAVPHFDFEMKELWRFDDFNFGIHSASKSTPVIYGDLAFAASDSSRLYSFDKLTGQERWQIVFDESSRGIHSTPSLDDRFLYVGNYRGGLYKIEQTSGAIVWNLDLGMTLGASLLTLGSDLIAVPETVNPLNGFLVRLNKDTCEVKWRSNFLGEQSHSSPVFDESKNFFVLGANNGVLQAFDASSGKRVWHRKMKGEIKSTPRLFEGHVYFTTWGKELVKVRVADGETIWSADIESRSQVSPVLIEENKLVVVANSRGVIFGYDIDSGKQLWRVDSRRDNQSELQNYSASYLSSPVLLRSGQQTNIFAYCSPRSVCLISLKGKVLRRFLVPGIVTGTFFFDQYNTTSRSILLPLAFREGPLVMYQLKFGGSH